MNNNKMPLAIALGTILSCTKAPNEPATSVAIVYDITDTLRSIPNAKNIQLIFQFESDQNSAMEYFLSPISNTKINAIYGFNLGNRQSTEKQNVHGMAHHRDSRIAKFCRDVATSVIETQAIFEREGSRPTSECFYSISAALTKLAASYATKKQACIYSNLFENNLTFKSYSREGQLAVLNEPDSVWRILTNGSDLPKSLAGIDVAIIYQPENIENEVLFLAFYKMYKKGLEARGASVRLYSSDKELVGHERG